MTNRTCTKCGNEYPNTRDFFYSKDKSGRLDSKCKICKKKYNTIKNKVNIKNRAVTEKRRRFRNKLLVISHYGGRCAICGESRLPFLTIDHINNDGIEHRKKLGGPQYFYKHLIDMKFPPEFRVLCWNHNYLMAIKSNRVYSIAKTSYRQRKRFDRKLQVLSHYGSKCQCCGEDNPDLLTIDHVNGGGNKHRRSIGESSGIHRWLVKNNFPDGFRLLCFNCNCGRQINGGVCPHTMVKL